MNANNKQDSEKIGLSLPVNAAYVSAARLTASSIANRLGFDIDEIEDIKAAVSEACTYVVKKAFGTKQSVFNIIFEPQKGKLNIMLSLDSIVEGDFEEMGLLMIKALMDEISINSGESFELCMRKIHKPGLF